MWKYRNRGVFSEWNRAAFWIAFFVWLATGFVIYGLDKQNPERTFPKAVYALPFVLAAAVILVRAILFRKEKHADDEYLAKAVPPEWHRLPLESDIIPKMQEACKSQILFAAVLLSILLLSVIFVMISQQFEREMTWICLIMLLLVILWGGKAGLRLLFWQHPPIDLEYTAIDVAYCTESRYYVRGGFRKDMSLYFFLPNSRYRVVLHNQGIDRNPPESVYFVRLHGIVHWIHWED